MSMNNPFNNPAFSVSSLTAAINLLPNTYGRLDELNLFPIKPVRTRQVSIEMRNGVLNLLPTKPVGAPGTVGTRGSRNLRALTIPHIPHDDVVLPEEVIGVRAFGSETELATLAGVMADKLQTMRNKHAITLEHLRMGALKGIVLDADGTELIDFYKVFDITPKVFSFELANPDTSIRDKCIELKHWMEDNLLGERMTGVRVLVGEDFMTKLTNHGNIKEAWKDWQNGEFFRSDQRAGFAMAGVVFEEYRATVSTGIEGQEPVRFIAKSEGHAFPVGTLDTFATYVAPADFNETVNTPGQLLYAKQEPRKFDRGTDLHTQSNPLPVCQRPGLLVKVTL